MSIQSKKIAVHEQNGYSM